MKGGTGGEKTKWVLKNEKWVCRQPSSTRTEIRGRWGKKIKKGTMMERVGGIGDGDGHSYTRRGLEVVEVVVVG